jgi:hypothetical protein
MTPEEKIHQKFPRSTTWACLVCGRTKSDPEWQRESCCFECVLVDTMSCRPISHHILLKFK